MTRDRRLRGETQNSRIKGQKGMSSFFCVQEKKHVQKRLCVRLGVRLKLLMRGLQLGN